MIYADARSRIKSGDLIAFSGETMAGRAIRHFTGDRYSHVGIAAWVAVDGAGDRLLLIESMEGRGVSMRPLSGLSGFYWVTHDGVWSEKVIDFAWGKIGVTGYDWGDIMRRLFGWDLKANDRYICSELAGEMLRLQGLAIWPEEFGDPGRLVDAVLENGGVAHKIINSEDLDARIQKVVTSLQSEVAVQS